LKALTKLIGQVVEISVLGKGADDNERNLPFTEVGVLDNVDEVLGHDGLEDAEERQRRRAARKIRFLRGLEEIRAATYREEECVGKPLGRKAQVDRRGEIAQNQCLGDELVDVALSRGVNVESVFL
jgi:hypothetical protein